MKAPLSAIVVVIVAVAIVSAGCVGTSPLMGVASPSPSQLSGRLYQNLTANVTKSAGELILDANISVPSGVGMPVVYLGVLITPNASGVLSIKRHALGNDSTEQLNSGTALFGGGTYTFVVPVLYGEETNFVYSQGVLLRRFSVMDLYEGDYADIQLVNGTVKYS